MHCAMFNSRRKTHLQTSFSLNAGVVSQWKDDVNSKSKRWSLDNSFQKCKNSVNFNNVLLQKCNKDKTIFALTVVSFYQWLFKFPMVFCIVWVFNSSSWFWSHQTQTIEIPLYIYLVLDSQATNLCCTQGHETQ